jgi:hypothetical protein
MTSLGAAPTIYASGSHPDPSPPWPRAKPVGKKITGDQCEFYLLDDHPEEQSPYKPGSWEPKQADAPIAANGSWQNPKPEETA